MIEIKNYNDFKEHIISCYPQEGCGFVVDGMFIPVENIAEDPSNLFQIDLEESKKYEGTDYAVIHSHTMLKWDITFDPRTPSYEDMLSQEATDVPFGIVHCDGENITDILWFGVDEIPPLINRDYISNVQDCFALARDYYRLNYNITFGTQPRPADWQEWNPYTILQRYQDLGFYEIKIDDILPGDALLYSIASRTPNHIGIVTSKETFLHHLHNRKSCEDSIAKWKRQFSKALRHKEVNQ
jgi:proteasome lid subunit RPN8/RPN11